MGTLAAMAYAANDFGRAIELWERVSATESDEYRRAKAHIELFPTNLRWFNSLKEHKQVLQEWQKHRTELPDLSKMDDWVIVAVTDSALAEGDLLLAAEMLEIRPDNERAGKLLVAAANNGEAELTSKAAILAAKALVQTRDWKAAIRVAEEAYFPGLADQQQERVRSILGKSNGVTDVFRIVVEELAVSDQLPAETLENQTTVGEFLNRHFVGESRAVRQSRAIPPEIVGAAIERAGKIVDALQFYEDLARQASSTQQQKFAMERLIRNLEQHAEYQRSRGEERQARQRQLRAQQLRERSRIGSAKLSEYPTLRTTSDHDGSTEWTRGPFKIVLSRSHGRLRIEHAERFETVTLNWKDAVLLGDANFSQT